MNADAILLAQRAAVRRRRCGNVVLFAAPWLGALAILAWRCDWNAWLLLVWTLAVVAMCWIAVLSARTVDARWLARRLDALRTDMEDSAALLFTGNGLGAGQPGPLQGLQRERLRQRLLSGAPVDLREPWRMQALLASALAALAVAAAIALWPAPSASRPAGNPTSAAPASGTAAAPRLARQRLDIHPPAYTGLPTQRQTGLDARVTEGATLQWTLRFTSPPASAELVFHDGRRLPLQRDGDDWTARARIDRPTLYRIVLPTPLPPAQAVLHRIDAIADTPPVVRALQPDRNLSLRASGQRQWTLVFEAEDDHGLAPAARLQLTQTQGGGENITAQQRTMTIAGSGSSRRRRYARTLDLATLRLVAGDDLIVQLEVADNRSPAPQRTRSASFILRWPPEPATESTGMDALVQKALPAYLRSQRQIILDAEALLAEKRKLDAAAFLQRSDGLGVDQRMLRLRYGQFLGEESEGAPELPTNDLPTNDLPTNDAAERHDAAPTDSHAGHDDHAPAPGAAPGRFGEADAVVAEYGHVHDLPEAATLLDPETRTLLRAALDQMWQSELHLRQGSPAAALPFAYRALGFIKQVQQADRIYLARTGTELPPIDEGRRLGGDRSGLGDRRDVLADRAPVDPVPAAAWRALQDLPRSDRTRPDYDALARWARTNGSHASDPLALFAAIDAARRDPDCMPCRQRLREALWPQLPRPTAAPGRRERGDTAGQTYLQALGRGEPR